MRSPSIERLKRLTAGNPVRGQAVRRLIVAHPLLDLGIVATFGNETQPLAEQADALAAGADTERRAVGNIDLGKTAPHLPILGERFAQLAVDRMRSGPRRCLRSVAAAAARARRELRVHVDHVDRRDSAFGRRRDRHRRQERSGQGRSQIGKMVNARPLMHAAKYSARRNSAGSQHFVYSSLGLPPPEARSSPAHRGNPFEVKTTIHFNSFQNRIESWTIGSLEGKKALDRLNARVRARLYRARILKLSGGVA